jgi:hypothetical protein
MSLILGRREHKIKKNDIHPASRAAGSSAGPPGAASWREKRHCDKFCRQFCFDE